MKFNQPISNLLERINHSKLAGLRDRRGQLPFVAIVLGCSLVLSLVFSGPQTESDGKEEVFTEDFNFPDIRSRGNNSPAGPDQATVAEAPAAGDQKPLLRDVERIPMPEPDFGLPRSESLPGASSYPSSQPEVVDNNRQSTQKSDDRDWVLVEPTSPSKPRKVEPRQSKRGELDRSRFQCSSPILETLGQIAVAEVERSCGVQISYQENAGVVINSGDRIGVEFDFKVPTSGTCSHKCETTPKLENQPIANIASVIVRSIWEELR